MTANEKAEELFNSFSGDGYYLIMSQDTAKQCALIAVDEIIDLVIHIDVDSEEYWKQVKQEIENL